MSRDRRDPRHRCDSKGLDSGTREFLLRAEHRDDLVDVLRKRGHERAVDGHQPEGVLVHQALIPVGVEEALDLPAHLRDARRGGRLLAVLGGRGDSIEASVRGAVPQRRGIF